MKFIIIICLFYFWVNFANATQWLPFKIKDPITGDDVTGHGIGSFESDIYNSPSKFDLIFLPWTDENSIWLCPNSGYASFFLDFKELSDQEKELLSRWLKMNYDPLNPPKTHKEKLLWLEKVYAQRNKGEEFWLLFYRLMAYIFRDEHQRSLEYVRKALPLLEQKLKDNIEGIRRIEVLYLLGEYNRRNGREDKAVEYFTQVKNARYKLRDGTEIIGHPYFLELIKDRERFFQSMPAKIQYKIVYANWPKVSLREGPGLIFKTLAEIRKGTALTVLEDQGQWLRVILEDGREGWIGKATISETP